MKLWAVCTFFPQKNVTLISNVVLKFQPVEIITESTHIWVTLHRGQIHVSHWMLWTIHLLGRTYFHLFPGSFSKLSPSKKCTVGKKVRDSSIKKDQNLGWKEQEESHVINIFLTPIVSKIKAMRHFKPAKTKWIFAPGYNFQMKIRHYEDPGFKHLLYLYTFPFLCIVPWGLLFYLSLVFSWSQQNPGLDASASTDPAALSFYLIVVTLESSDKSLMTIGSPRKELSQEPGNGSSAKETWLLITFKPKAQSWNGDLETKISL